MNVRSTSNCLYHVATNEALTSPFHFSRKAHCQHLPRPRTRPKHHLVVGATKAATYHCIPAHSLKAPPVASVTDAAQRGHRTAAPTTSQCISVMHPTTSNSSTFFASAVRPATTSILKSVSLHLCLVLGLPRSRPFTPLSHFHRRTGQLLPRRCPQPQTHGRQSAEAQQPSSHNVLHHCLPRPRSCVHAASQDLVLVLGPRTSARRKLTNHMVQAKQDHPCSCLPRPRSQHCCSSVHLRTMPPIFLRTSFDVSTGYHRTPVPSPPKKRLIRQSALFK